MLKLRKVLSGLAAITMLCGSMAFISATTLENADEQAAVAETEQKSSKIHDEVYAEINAGKSTVDVMIKYQKPDSAKIKEANEISKSEAKEYAATLDTEKYSEKEILKMEEDYMVKRVNELVGVLYDEQRAKIFKEIGVDMNSEELNLHYLENGELYDLMFCTLTPAQIEKASNSELVKRISLESSFMNQPERQGTTVPDNVQNNSYYILYKDIDTKAIDDEAAQKKHDYIYSLYADGADDYEVEIKSTDYYQEVRLGLIKAAYQEESAKVIEELGINKENAFCSMFSPTIICQLSDEQLARAEKSNLIENVSTYDPINPIPTTEKISYSTKKEFISLLTNGKDAAELFGENIKIDAELNCKNGDSFNDYIIIYGLKSDKEIVNVINKLAQNQDLRIIQGTALERSGTMFSISSDKINNTNKMYGFVFVDDEFPNWVSKKDIPTFTKMYSFNPSKYIIRLGDTNSDYKIDATDASDILITYSKLSTETDFKVSETAISKMDIDTNGKIDAADATMVLQYYAYLSTDGTDSLKEFIMNIS